MLHLLRYRGLLRKRCYTCHAALEATLSVLFILQGANDYVRSTMLAELWRTLSTDCLLLFPEPSHIIPSIAPDLWQVSSHIRPIQKTRLRSLSCHVFPAVAMILVKFLHLHELTSHLGGGSWLAWMAPTAQWPGCRRRLQLPPQTETGPAASPLPLLQG